jgi:hypothetical protein
MERDHGEPGTYRRADGRFVHVRRGTNGELVIEAELTSRSAEVWTLASVKLSDDPDWPGLRPIAPLGPHLFD